MSKKSTARCVFLVLSFWLCLPAMAAPRPEITSLFKAIELAEDHRQVDDPALLQAVHSKTAWIRARAALAFGRIQNPAGVSPLLSLLKDTQEKVRRSAAFSLGQLGWDASFTGGAESSISQALSALLKDSSEGVRVAAVEALGKIGLQDAPSQVEPALEDPSAKVRAEASLALFRYQMVMNARAVDPSSPKPGVLSDQIFQKLLKNTSDTSLRVSRSAVYSLARLKDPRALESLSKLALSSDVWVRYFAITGLGRLADAKGAAGALAGTTDAHWYTRVTAIQALSAMKSVSMIPLSLALDPSVHVRATLADALAAGDSAEGVNSLQRLWKDSSSSVRASALKSLASRQGEASGEVLVQASVSKDWIIRQAAVDASSALSAAQEAFLLKLSAVETDVRVRASILEAFGPIATPGAFNAILAGLKSDQLAERGSALDALSSRKEPGVLSAAWDCYQRSGDSKWTEQRESILDIVIQVPGDESTGYLRQALADSAASVSLKARKALEVRGVTDLPPAAKPTLTFSPYASMRFKTNPHILVETTRGSFELELYKDAAPVHVANLVGFAQQGFYNGLIWHRVVPGFVIQGGDPDGTGWGDAGFSLRAEVNGHRFGRGVLGMPRAQGFDTGGVQLFITHVPTPHLDGQYTVFGRVIRGMDVVDRVEMGDLIVRMTIVR